jgi:TetR/AcrR family transcriptional repressor of nem operon
MSATPKKKPPQTVKAPPTAAATAILDVAERLAQRRGYNGFSYADIAVELGVTKASLHYHYPSKAELGCALIERYRSVFAATLDDIDHQALEPHRRLQAYVGLYDSVMRDDRMCLCGMLAAEFATLPKPMQEGLRLFFEVNEQWLRTVLKDGVRTGHFVFKESANERARVLLGGLEGAMLVARSYGDPQRFRAAAQCLLADLNHAV